MNTIEFLKGWKRNFVTIFLDHNVFENKKDEFDKVTEILTLFSPYKVKLQFNTDDHDAFFEKVLSTNAYDIKVIHVGKKLFSRKQYRLIEIHTNESLFFNLIKLAIEHKITLEFELIFNEQIKVIGILYGDAGESHTIHFDTKFFRTEEIKIEVNNIFK